ncbi:hypothetical protein B5E41_30125 [Rhizobium esperanzae]|uniref:Uncharacterized protein n=1 Tax=Rhizobium esperanzae TaxID=1967781 RepID=A0A246DKV8_9HYPH|nr:hypothetical protein B5E41_30125 [Rhizobium esperanzae]
MLLSSPAPIRLMDKEVFRKTERAFVMSKICSRQHAEIVYNKKMRGFAAMPIAERMQSCPISMEEIFLTALPRIAIAIRLRVDWITVTEIQLVRSNLR